ncbi:DNA replication and repair protein RecO [Micromonospora phaseoli]|uniref:DNA repair protein RecO n=1 Tax=Micromonospora phaseoli TaxID=1144548 RepID=A0A1H7CGS4_9ACTN|nr:DNA repair protein RecO [Micromonospora phaseoli]PZV97798.1 DNA replication and repair protein RecO [Micromonospora phaseoli]GIJ78466.1 DNA repair protein RecO [Micromonospora phaseoli]SEJ88899.1 DNA replication and repair protein RecO [Micromonospora phaseoli]
MAGYRRQLYRDDAVVLRVQKLGESDRIITLLTRRHGRLRAVARGVRRTTSKFGARLEPFGHVDLQLAGDPKGELGSSLHSVSQVEGIDLYGKRFLGDYPRYTAASAIAETAERLTPVEREPSLRLFQLTLGALRALAEGSHATTLVLDAYLLRGMALAGWAPALIACAVCGTPGRHRAFSVPAGGAVCPDCRPPGAAHPAPATIDLMSALAVGDWRVADATETGVRRECSGLVAAHLQWHLERALRSLPLVDRGGGPAAPGALQPPGDLPAVVPPPRAADAGPPDRASQDVSRE